MQITTPQKKNIGLEELVVIDSSAVLKWFFRQDEEKPHLALKAREKHLNYEIILCAPELIYFEVINTMVFRIQDETLLVNNLKSLLIANIETFYQNEESVLATAKIAKKYGTTFYDSCYLYLAIKNDAKLLTYDKKLLGAAISEGVKIYD
ncbi:MAG: type II toxin-antitoxin system VapC family toxin [Actinobacteria bacterium]|nr:type II toxin-antitoxin system VapC family toxin [Actinomycetota bacterium]